MEECKHTKMLKWVGEGDRRLYCTDCNGLFCIDDGRVVKIVDEQGNHARRDKQK
jgi:hypothetical protein